MVVHIQCYNLTSNILRISTNRGRDNDHDNIVMQDAILAQFQIAWPRNTAAV